MILFWALLAMLLHELGHVAAALLLGVPIRKVGIRLKGFYLVRDSGSPLKNLLVTLAGPATNVIFMLAFWNGNWYFWIANMCFAAANLAPIRNSDGDRALNCIAQL